MVGDGGMRPNAREVLLRNLVKVMVLATGLWPLMLMVLLNRNRQRLGDMMGRTAVADVHPVPAPPPETKKTDDDGSQET